MKSLISFIEAIGLPNSSEFYQQHCWLQRYLRIKYALSRKGENEFGFRKNWKFNFTVCGIMVKFSNHINCFDVSFSSLAGLKLSIRVAGIVWDCSRLIGIESDFWQTLSHSLSNLLCHRKIILAWFFLMFVFDLEALWFFWNRKPIFNLFSQTCFIV